MAEDKKDKKEEKGNEAQPDEAVAKSKKKRLLILGGLGALLVLGAAIGVFLMTSGGSKKEEHGETMSAEEPKAEEKAAEHAPAEHGEKPKQEAKAEGGHGGGEKKAEGEHGGGGEHGKEAADKKPAEAKPTLGDFGETFALKTFHLNLGNPLENNYVRLEISVEFRGGQQQKDEIEKRMPQLRDAVVNIASRKTREFLLSPDGKHQLRKEILTQFNRYMTKPIDSVFITDLLIE